LPSDRADIAAAVYTRLFFWDLDPARDLQRGDTVRMAYTWDGSMVDIPAASYTSSKLGGTLLAYRFHATGDDWPSFWDGEGREIAHRLKDGPLLNYQQITSRLKDRPGHKGMDFKVPTGTDVVNPKSGKVLRTNWNIRYNGNCVEVKYDDGTLARFLHLSRTDVSAGDTVGKGTRLGLSGNTGRSTAPHLHYELEKGGKVLDPIDYHGTVRRALSDGDMSRFDGVVAQWSPTLLPR
jgi:murein DD-endopeptidase